MNVTAVRKDFVLSLEDNGIDINLNVETPSGEQILIAYFSEGIFYTLENDEDELKALESSGLKFDEDRRLVVV